MALLKFNKTNTQVVVKREATIRINRLSAFSLSKATCENAALEAGNKIGFLYDDESGDWYLTKDPEGYELRTTSSGKGLCFSSAGMANKMLDISGLEGNNYLFRVAKEPIKLENKARAWCIIIASAKAGKN